MNLHSEIVHVKHTSAVLTLPLFSTHFSSNNATVCFRTSLHVTDTWTLESDSIVSTDTTEAVTPN